MKDLQENLSSTTPVQVRAIVFSPTGTVKGLTKANVTVAQLTLNGGNWVVKNAGTDSSSSPDRCTPNQFNINVNTFTGRIKIETPDQY
jgi:hypothetical protein